MCMQRSAREGGVTRGASVYGKPPALGWVEGQGRRAKRRARRRGRTDAEAVAVAGAGGVHGIDCHAARPQLHGDPHNSALLRLPHDQARHPLEGALEALGERLEA